MPAISDHMLVFATLQIPIPIFHIVTSHVWDFRQARWDDLMQHFLGIDWGPIIVAGSIEQAAD
eukprot:15914771-Heterocapsa_arctica.AAC.1